MTKFLSERDALHEIASGIATSPTSRLAVAFWGDGAASRLGIETNPKAVEIVCNLRMGGTNPAEIARLIQLGVRVSHCDRLHAKVYLFSDRAIIGSSNASSNGLSFQGDEAGSWIEANILTHDEAVRKKIERWWKLLPAKPVTDADLAIAKTAWSKRRSGMRSTSEGVSLLEELRRTPTSFDGKGVYLTVYGSLMDDEGYAGREIARNEFGSTLETFQDWQELPREGHLVCFWRGSRGAVRQDGIYERRRNPPDRKLENSRLHLCWKESNVLGLRVLHDELPAWKSIVERVRGSDLWDHEQGTALVDLSVVARRFL